jgi:hypothetical protein
MVYEPSAQHRLTGSAHGFIKLEPSVCGSTVWITLTNGYPQILIGVVGYRTDG